LSNGEYKSIIYLPGTSFLFSCAMIPSDRCTLVHFGELFLQKVHLRKPNAGAGLKGAGLKGAGVLSVLFSLYILYIGPFYYKKHKKKSAPKYTETAQSKSTGGLWSGVLFSFPVYFSVF